MDNKTFFDECIDTTIENVLIDIIKDHKAFHFFVHRLTAKDLIMIKMFATDESNEIHYVAHAINVVEIRYARDPEMLLRDMITRFISYFKFELDKYEQ